MHLRKVCPHCKTILHVRRAVCGCSHAFPSKRKAPNNTDEERVKRRKALESEQEKLCRKEQNLSSSIKEIRDSVFTNVKIVIKSCVGQTSHTVDRHVNQHKHLDLLQ